MYLKVTGIALSLRTYRKRVPGYYLGNTGLFKMVKENKKLLTFLYWLFFILGIIIIIGGVFIILRNFGIF